MTKHKLAVVLGKVCAANLQGRMYLETTDEASMLRWLEKSGALVRVDVPLPGYAAVTRAAPAAPDVRRCGRA